MCLWSCIVLLATLGTRFKTFHPGYFDAGIAITRIRNTSMTIPTTSAPDCTVERMEEPDCIGIFRKLHQQIHSILCHHMRWIQGFRIHTSE